MRKIGIIAFATENNGGIFQYAQSMIDAIKNDATNKYIIFTNTTDNRFDNYNNLEIRKYDKKPSSKFVQLFRLITFTLNIRSSIFMNQDEKKIFHDIDIFLSPIIKPYPHYYLNKPYILTLHDMQERYYPKFFSYKERLLRYIFNRSLAKSASKIICESEYVKNDIIKFIGIDPNKINVIQSPPPEEFVSYKIDEAQFNVVKSKYNLPNKFIFYPAQCWHHKNHIKLVEAFKLVSDKMDDIYLILTGSQKDNYDSLMQRVKELDLDSKVKHLGYIDYEDLPVLYKMSQFLVMPTLFESVSIPIYEAFALEVAVCSSNVVALPEQVGDAGLIFNPNDINDMAEKMMMYLSDDNLRNHKARQGFEQVKNFNHLEYKNKLLKLWANTNE